MKRNLCASSHSTFHFQESLPRLPVPELKNTFDKYLKTLEPIVTQKELSDVKLKIDDLLKPNGVGQELQAKLIKRAEDHKETSWLHDWWNNYAYMDYRESLVNNVSFCYLFENSPSKPNQVERAANFVSYLLHLKKSIEDEVFPPDVIRNVPQCMNAYKSLFSTCRIPIKNRDESIKFGPRESTHIIVARNNQFYEVNVHNEKGEPLHKDDIKILLENVVRQSDSGSNVAPVGLLTADHRDKWADVRARLLESNINKKSLHSIESSGFLLCLDNMSPKDENDAAVILLNGKTSNYAANRFFDKTLNIVVFENGVGGLVGEHSRIDGYPVTVLTDIMLQQERDQKVIDVPRTQKLTNPIKLDWDVNNVQTEIKRVAQEHDNACKSLGLNILRYQKYGKNLIKKFGFSPDGYLQLAFHLAYYRLHNNFAPTYESCSTRKYAYGRTETGRTLSTDVVRFIESMSNPNTNDAERHQLLTTAIKSHIAYIKEASEGYGCDRHILGLKLTGQEIGVDHPFFSDPTLGKSSHWLLSTSQLPSKYSITGYGPVVSDGYGLFYNLRNDSFNFVITNIYNESKTDCHKMSEALSNSLDEISQLCASNLQSKL